MNDNQILMNDNKQSFYFIFSSPIDIVYHIFVDNIRLYLPGCRIIGQKYSTFLDFQGNEITVEITTNSSKTYIYTFKVENVINLSHFKSFTHKSINNPVSCSDFLQVFEFYWNSTDKTTIFKFICQQMDNVHENIMSNHFLDNKDKICLNIENSISEMIKNREENESISIEKNIEEVWEFISNLNNQKFFFNFNENNKINVLDNDKIEIFNYDKSVKNVYFVKRRNENKYRKYLDLELIESNVSIPNQKMVYNLISINKNKTFFLLKHIILEYIPYDILMSYSSKKRKILKSIKCLLEGKEYEIDDEDD